MTLLIPHLAEVARETREDNGVSREEVAVAARKSADSVRYFERGEQAATLDSMVEAYGEALGVDPLEIWERALKRASEERDRERAELEAAEAEAASLRRGRGASARRPRQGASRTQTRAPRRRDG